MVKKQEEKKEEKQFKKASDAIEGKVSYIQPSKLDEDSKGSLIKGTFVESIKSPFDEGKFDYKFETEDGKIIIINNTGHLQALMSKIPIGSFCEVIYQGRVPFKSAKTKKNVLTHQFEVLYY